MTVHGQAWGPIRALICDMDGLLVDSEPLAESAMVAFLRRHERELRPDAMGQTLGRRLPEAMALIAEIYGLTDPLDILMRDYGEMRLAALRGHLRPMPGAAELIAFARDARLKLALATSSERSHADVSLAEAGLSGLFDAEVTGDAVERGKPAPDIFLAAARRLDIAPAACVVLEDAPAGIAAAHAAGMRAVCVPNSKTRALPFPISPDLVVPDLAAVIPWLWAQGVTAPGTPGGGGASV